jgi:uncharacterized protein YbjT (DUF2867 family)
VTVGPVLVTGGTGKTGRRLAAQLRSCGVRARAASRHPVGDDDAVFDWNDQATWGPALAEMGSVYLVAPAGGDPAPVLVDFCERALDTGVARLVLLSASLLEPGAPGMGQVHAWLAAEALDWAVLRPSWMLQNLSEGPHRATIRDSRLLETAAGDGRVPLIDAGDIAAVAVSLLTRSAAFNSDVVLTGPAPVSYDDVASTIGAALGEAVTHRRLTMDELSERHQERGLAREYADTLAFMDLLIESGAEDRVTDGVETLTGRPPVDLEQFVTGAVSAWQ